MDVSPGCELGPWRLPLPRAATAEAPAEQARARRREQARLFPAFRNEEEQPRSSRVRASVLAEPSFF